jgi:hypothetical protein
MLDRRGLMRIIQVGLKKADVNDSDEEKDGPRSDFWVLEAVV